MTTEEILTLRKRFARWQCVAFVISILALGLCSLGAIQETRRFFHSYLFIYLFWIELTLGSIALLMVHHVAGGAWGIEIRRILEASAGTIYMSAVLFLPIIFGSEYIYSWNHSDFFSIRAAFYFFFWITMVFLLNRWSRSRFNNPFLKSKSKLKTFSAAGLILFGMSIVFSAVDWQMSLTDDRYPIIDGITEGIEQGLGAWAFTLLVFWIFSSFQKNPFHFRKRTFSSLGNVLLVFTLVSGCLSLIQYSFIWFGESAESPSWITAFYHKERLWLTLSLLLIQIGVPIFMLTSKKISPERSIFVLLCVSILLVRILDRYRSVMPQLPPAEMGFVWVDFVLVLALGGLWIGNFLFILKDRLLFARDEYTI